MTEKTFVDSNILIYAHDLASKEKRLTAEALLRELWANRNGVLSPQVLQEFYVNAWRRRNNGLIECTPFAGSPAVSAHNRGRELFGVLCSKTNGRPHSLYPNIMESIPL